MNRWAVLLSLTACGIASAADPLPPGLDAEKVRDGWIALFDGESTFGWKPGDGAKVEDGRLVLAPGAEVTSTFSFGPGRLQIAVASGRAEGSSAAAGAVAPATVRNPGDEPAKIASVLFRPEGLEPIFNGKDLSGWKVFPGERYTSEFTVCDEGTLEVKDGPGDLQTEEQWKDFVLQFECRSNGKHLNSGIFFRALPDQYQQGYEAQIRNEWEGDDRTKPVDFGTGAIYRRQPARKVTATDGEWFTMTLIARGNHIATWVNGYQAVDFVDERPEADNARQGTKLGAGAISIQGHDPTTDLSFRSIRIAALPGSGD